MPSKNRNIEGFVITVVLALVCAGCDQSPKRLDGPPLLSSTPASTSAEATEVQVVALLVKKAAALNTGRTGDEQWSNVDYSIWKPGASDETVYGGVIRGNIRRFKDEKSTALLAYKASLTFEHGTWTFNDVIGKEITFLPVHLLTEHDLPSDPLVDASAQGLDTSAAQASAGLSRQLAYLQRVLENRQREADSFKVAEISTVDQNAIQKRLENLPANLPPDADSGITEHIISWGEVDSFFSSKENTEMQKSEEWKRYNGKKVNWTGILERSKESTDSNRFGDPEMDMEMDGHSDGATVYLKPSEKTKALGVHPGDRVEYRAKLSYHLHNYSLRDAGLDDGEIISVTSKEQLKRENDEAARQKQIADQAERERFSRLGTDAPSPKPATSAFKTVADAQREALRRYPELGVSGSRFNAAFFELYDRYQQELPTYFSDPAWPLKIADHVSHNDINIPGIPVVQLPDD